MGVLDYTPLFDGVQHEFTRNDPSLVAGMILILVGAFAKSAQIPLHTWLPDAMEGPTPVSALIHAATMVTAGVYLIGRLHPLFEWAPTAADVGAIAGGVTLLIAGTIGLVVTDVKRVIAYSTMSQIGYMIMAVSAAAYAGAFFHLMTHAFFKALLFMAAGSLIAAMGGEQSLERMRGFRKAMPFTFACFVIGSLALSRSRCSPASSPRTRCCTRSASAAAGGSCSTSPASSARSSPSSTRGGWCSAPSTASPARRRASSSTGTSYHAAEPVNPATGELEDPRSGSPAPITTSPSRPG